jgi:hypothetical protein
MVCSRCGIAVPTFARIGRRTSTSGTSDLQANRDTATIAITVMMATISASWM